MEPMLPPAGDRRLEDLALDLATKASALAGRLAPPVRQGVGDLLRFMNCYYSNLIEGHDTHPRDIDRALAHADYAADPVRRALQREAVAHIEVQRIIDRGEDPADVPTSVAYITWLHREFCRRLPDELLFVENPDTGERLRVLPGEIRQGWVQVGRHIPPSAGALPAFLQRFGEVYAMERLPRLGRIVALGAAHHRLLWIHPFPDGNGRVARLMSHAALLRCGVGSSLVRRRKPGGGLHARPQLRQSLPQPQRRFPKALPQPAAWCLGLASAQRCHGGCVPPSHQTGRRCAAPLAQATEQAQTLLHQLRQAGRAVGHGLQSGHQGR